jgi:riboflavin kinase/FMN adenylyltransferase
MKIKGKVIKGNHIATEIGFPTANIKLEEISIDPGIYAGKVFVGGEVYKSALYISNSALDILEAHLIDFGGDLYGQEIDVEIYDKVRGDFNIVDKTKLHEIIANDIEMIQLELDKNL